MAKKKLEEDVRLEYRNGKNNPPDVVIMENGREKIRWIFTFDNMEGEYYSEAHGIDMLPKYQPLGKDRKRAIELYNSVIVHKK